MAYNNGFPMNYQQSYYPQVQSQQVNNGIIWVQGEASAKSYPVAPNTSVPLWDSEANVIYIKSADMSGMPSIKTLDYTIRNNQTRVAEAVPQTNFATKDDIEALRDEIDLLKSRLKHTQKGKVESDGK